jgi:hypothetical protein
MSHNPAPTLTVRSYDTSPQPRTIISRLVGLDGRRSWKPGRSAAVPTGGGLVIAPVNAMISSPRRQPPVLTRPTPAGWRASASLRPGCHGRF